jgi:NTP pyrophosphatase (non-canonical NTP hydrolase)
MTNNNLDEIADNLHKIAKTKGFWRKVYLDGTTYPIQDIDFMLAKLALVHSEISEVLEAMRKQMGEEKIVEELVDIFIRLMDFYAGAKATGWVTSSFDEILEKKVGINKERPPMHGNLA